jgi:hypothetical protein
MAKKPVVTKSQRGSSPESSDNVPMTRREIATAVAKRKKKSAFKRPVKKITKKSMKKARKKKRAKTASG